MCDSGNKGPFPFLRSFPGHIGPQVNTLVPQCKVREACQVQVIQKLEDSIGTFWCCWRRLPWVIPFKRCSLPHEVAKRVARTNKILYEFSDGGQTSLQTSELFKAPRWWHLLNGSYLSVVNLDTSVSNNKAQKFSQRDVKCTLKDIHIQLALS